MEASPRKLDPVWTLDNYEKIFSKSYLIDGLFNSIEVSLTVVAVSVLVAYPLAYVLAYRVPARWRKLMLVLLILPFWTSYLVRSYAWSVVLGDNGIVNSTLLAIGSRRRPRCISTTAGAPPCSASSTSSRCSSP